MIVEGAMQATLYACGFNAFGQLVPGPEEDVFELQKMSISQDDGNGDDTELLFSGWSETTFYRPSKNNPDGHLVRLGNTGTLTNQSLPLLGSAFGDHNGLLGVLCKDGKIGFVQDNAVHMDTSISSKIAHIALAENGRVALALKPLDHSETNIVEFESLGSLRKWSTDILDFGCHHKVPASVVQLIANATGFVCLTQDGNVYTWGDARHGSLGRGVSETEAEHPGLVDSLAGIRIKRIASSGWLTAALSEDGAAYLFGTSTPGSEKKVTCLNGIDPTQAALINVEENDEPLDVLDIAVGDEHLLLLVQDGRIFAAGDNRNGQLGLGKASPDYIENWIEIKKPDNRRCKSLYAGPRCSLFCFED